MRFGLFIPQGWRMDLAGIAPADQWRAMHDVAAAADAGQVWESVWVYDHFHTVPVPSEQATHEAWSLMAALAASTSRVRLGQMCTCMAYRNPAYLAKVAATVDIISGGRVDDQRSVEARLLLVARMAVVPVRAVLPQLESISEGCARRNAVKAHPGNAVHLRRDEQPVPVDRGRFLQSVRHPDGGGFAFAKAQHRTGQHAVDDRWRGALPIDVDPAFGDHEIGDRSRAVRRRHCARQGGP